MNIKIINVFYDEYGYPFKDQERSVRFPIVGHGFQGANNTTQVKFYFSFLGDSSVTWVAVSKLPNGKIGSKVLQTYNDSELGEPYALLELDSFYTQYKGDIFISLQGYQGGVQVEYDSESELYVIHGTPTIQATGSVKFTNNYATQFVGSGETSNVNFQRILADLGTKLGIRAQSEHVEELPSVGQNDIFYVINDDPNNPNLQNIYVWNENTKHYIWVGDNKLDLGEYYTKEQGEQFKSDIDDRVTSVESELSSVAQGSPKGAYATLAALQAAYPTGTTGIYVVSADGHWYYWNGSAWTDGGVYLSSALDKELNVNSINGVQNKEIAINIYNAQKSFQVNNTTNIIDESSMLTITGYLDTTTGGMASVSANFKTSVYIKVFNSQYIANKDIARICFYDASYTFISGYNDIYVGDLINIPNNTSYIKISIRVAYLTGDFMLLNTNALPSSYIPFLHVVTETSEFYGKKMSCLGDSMINQERWQPNVVNLLKLNSYTVCGQSGAAVCDTIYRSVGDLDSNADFFIIWCGTNDWRAGNALGNPTDIGDGIHATTFYGGLNYIFKYIAQNFPSKKVLLLTPMQRYNTYDQQYETEYGYNSKGQIKNSIGLSLEDYVNAEILIANKYGYPVFNMYTDACVNRYNIGQYSGDGLHMNATNGAVYFSNLIAKMIKEKIAL